MAVRRKKGTTASQVVIPFDKGTPRYNVSKLLLKRGPHSWDELTEAAGGTLSTRTMGAVIVALEDAGARFNKYRHAEWGMTYEYDANAPLIGNHDGNDATGNHPPQNKGAKKVTAKKATRKTAKKATTKAAKTSKKASKATKASKVARKTGRRRTRR